ncbi:TniQ family protein [Methylorubrum rhodesianum]|uniref:TniQ family protein n=1 Tax=Methylorubrum TaxID=2282523 RepID=UPI0018E39CD0|nr:TniQ family protein [Methylorubrum sp. DB1722]MBI1691038.1 hypothetical protein [Methylorubrum sp. DB1722]
MTVARLVLTLALQAGESVASFLSRLSRHNGLLYLRHFCMDTGINFQGAVDGQEKEVRRLADMAGVAGSELQSWAFQRQGEGAYSLRGHLFSDRNLRRNQFYVCPACLREDVDGSDLDPELAAYGRSIWQVGFIRTCARHGSALVCVGQGRHPSQHDFTAMVTPHLDRLDALEAGASARPFSPCEAYLVARIVGGSQGDVPFLDSLDLQAAAKFCDVLGVVATHGPDRLLRGLNDSDLYRAAAAGFAIAAGGQERVREFWSDLQGSYPYNASPNEGPGRPLGVLYKWLSGVVGQPAYAPLIELARRHLLETTPVGPGDMLLGAPVDRRVLHSIRTASLETGAHPKRLRRILARAGMLVPEHASLKDDRALFAADAAVRLLADVSEGMSLKDLEAYMNCGRAQAQVLLENGLIKPVVHADDSKGWHLFAKADIDEFLARLTAGAELVEMPTGDMANIPSAAKRSSCSAAEVVRLILDGRLPWVGRCARTRGYLSVLVDPRAVRPLVRGEALGDPRLREVMAALKTSDTAVAGLIKIGALTSSAVTNPLNRCPVRVVDRRSLDQFRERYISSTDLSRSLALSALRVNEVLSNLGVQAALPKDQVKATFYTVADIELYMSRLREEALSERRKHFRPPRDPTKPPRGRGAPRRKSTQQGI